MPAVEIESYRVTTFRSSDTTKPVIRELDLKPTHTNRGTDRILIQFISNANLLDDLGVGSLVQNVIGVHAPISDFDHMYHILQTENPVYFYWKAGDRGLLIHFGISTNVEPTGEGLIDHSS